MVFWGVPAELEAKFLDFLRSTTEDDVLLDEDEQTDQFDWYYMQSHEPTAFSIYDNNFLLPRVMGEDDTAIKLAVSYAIATSVKLETFEVGALKTERERERDRDRQRDRETERSSELEK